MARTAQPRQPALEVEMPDVDKASTALATLNESTRDIMRNYSLASANPDVLISEIKGFQTSAVEAMFNIGVRLLVLRQVVPHGEWMSRLEDVGMNDRTARRIVQSTIKFADPRKARSEKLLTLGKGKLLELLVLDDEEIETLDKGGEVHELDLDDVARMSPSELRKALREARLNTEAKDALIESKDKKINDLDVKLKQAKKFKPSPDSEAQSLQEQAWLDEVAEAVKAVEVHFARLAVVTSDVLSNCANEAVSKRVADGLRYVHARIDEIAKANGFEQLDGDYTPEWLRDGNKA